MAHDPLSDVDTTRIFFPQGLSVRRYCEEQWYSRSFKIVKTGETCHLCSDELSVS